jgi:radical SAM superfamily enzyme YgiQ (UPF0313 family)
MTTNILLITPLNIPFKDINEGVITKRKLDPKYPVGNLCIGAYVKANVSNVDVRIVDYNTVAPRYFKYWGDNPMALDGLLDYGLPEFTPDIIGISVLFESNYFDLGETITFLRNVYPNSIIVLGGHLASACYDTFLREFDGLDAICYGEGEIPMADLAYECGDNNVLDYIRSTPSWITKDKINDTKFKPWNMSVAYLDSIPPYDLSMLDYPADYYNTNDNLFGLGTDKPVEKDIYMFATRGCPYFCQFCASQFVHGHKVRKYSVERIKSDVLYYNKTYGITSFPFLDDHFLADKDAALEILDFIYAHNFSCRIFNLAYIHLDREIIQALKRTGSDRVLITIDGLNEEFLRRVVKKPANFNKAREVIQICREEGLTVLSNIIIGFPGETEAMINKGVEGMMSMGANWYSILTAAPLHGSELYEICKREGYLDCGAEFEIDYNKTAICTPDFDPAWIQWKAYEVNLNLNFVNNYDMKNGEYSTALMMFRRVIEDVSNTHAFAFYYAAICARELGMDSRYMYYKSEYYGLLEKFAEWRYWAEHFRLEELT